MSSGAILAVPFAAVIKTVLREAGAPRRERMAALRESSGVGASVADTGAPAGREPSEARSS